MARHLNQLTSPISSYLKNRFSFTTKSKGRGHTLSPVLELAFLKGEAHLRQRFFKFLEQRHFDNPETQLHFWNLFQQGAEVFNQFCHTSGLTQAFKGQTTEEYQQHYSPEQLQYTAYCCLLWDLQINKNSALLHMATDRLFAHYIASNFPKEAAKHSVEQLKREIRKHLAKQWQLRPEIRESFKTEDDKVEFTLIARIPGYHPKSLITIEGVRLKTTRLNACKQLLQQLQQSFTIELPKARVEKASELMQPL